MRDLEKLEAQIWENWDVEGDTQDGHQGAHPAVIHNASLVHKEGGEESDEGELEGVSIGGQDEDIGNTSEGHKVTPTTDVVMWDFQKTIQTRNGPMSIHAVPARKQK